MGLFLHPIHRANRCPTDSHRIVPLGRDSQGDERRDATAGTAADILRPPRGGCGGGAQSNRRTARSARGRCIDRNNQGLITVRGILIDGATGHGWTDRGRLAAHLHIKTFDDIVIIDGEGRLPNAVG